MQNKTLTLPDPPLSWKELSWAQLVYISKTNRDMFDSEMAWKLNIWTYLTNLELCRQSYYQTDESNQQPIEETTDDAGTLQKYTDKILYGENNDTGTLICIFRRKGIKHKRERLGIEVKRLQTVISSQLSWIDDKFKLPSIPRKTIKINGRRYKLPDPLLSNLTYEQLQNAQRSLENYWQISRQAEKHYEEKTLTPERSKQFASRMKRCREQFLAHLLTPRSMKLSLSTPILKQVYEYDSIKADQDKNMSKAPVWLFNICSQHFESCISTYQQTFPDLFSGGGSSEKKESPLLMEIGTINAVMKYAGYKSQQDVYDSNALFILKYLDTMTKEAKEIDRMNKKSQSK